MKNAFAVFGLILVLVTSVYAEEFDLGFGLTSVSQGFAHFDWADDKDVDGVQRIRPRFTITKQGSKFGLFTELDLASREWANKHDGNGNFVERFVLTYQISENTSVHVGRLFWEDSTILRHRFCCGP